MLVNRWPTGGPMSARDILQAAHAPRPVDVGDPALVTAALIAIWGPTLTVSDAARKIGVSPRKIRVLISEGRLRRVDASGCTRVDTIDVLRLVGVEAA